MASAERVGRMITSLGEQIRLLRTRRKLKLAEVAQRSGLSVNGLSMIERGEVDPKFSSLARIANALDIDFHELIAPEPDLPAIQKRDEFLSSFREVVDEWITARFELNDQIEEAQAAAEPER